MSKTISGNCSWCGIKKQNRYGLCPICHRFPSQQDYRKWDKEIDLKQAAGTKRR